MKKFHILNRCRPEADALMLWLQNNIRNHEDYDWTSFYTICIYDDELATVFRLKFGYDSI